MANMHTVSMIRENNLCSFAFALKTSLDVNSNICGDSLLHWSVRYQRFVIVKLLLDNNANVNQTNFDSWTPLHVAAYHGHIKIALLLIDNGANPKVTTWNNKTIFDIAKIRNNQTFIKAINYYLICKELWNCWEFE